MLNDWQHQWNEKLRHSDRISSDVWKQWRYLIFFLPVFDLFYLYLFFFIYLYLIYLTFIWYHLTITITLLLQEESDQLRVNVLQAEAAVSKMKYDSKKVARGADVAQQVCVEVLANAQLLAASHTRKSDIKRRAYERHVKVLQVSLRLP